MRDDKNELNEQHFSEKKIGYADLNLCPISHTILNQSHGSKTTPSDILAESE